MYTIQVIDTAERRNLQYVPPNTQRILENVHMVIRIPFPDTELP